MNKKLITPIIIIAIVIAFIVLYFGTFICIPEFPITLKIIFGVLLMFFSGVAVFVLIERIKEIRSGEEDDLSKY